ncbi:hypothetical protein [Natrinema sp. DC36]|uniref:hypothetical protein n=1 Tax=Natrinema sp. DC36 TaxID=2878680 RepID=UPI001CEFC3D3|nr:hypothetical protein [Natrinema sp. DC36]
MVKDGAKGSAVEDGTESGVVKDGAKGSAVEDGLETSHRARAVSNQDATGSLPTGGWQTVRAVSRIRR